MKTTNRLAAAALAFAAGPLYAHDGDSPGHATIQLAQAAADMTQGEVRKIDRENRKLTIKHGEIRNLDMPPMTMVFQASDAKLLDGLKVGDKVKFRAEKVDGAYAVTAIEPRP